jgi:hypothetical protein
MVVLWAWFYLYVLHFGVFWLDLREKQDYNTILDWSRKSQSLCSACFFILGLHLTEIVSYLNRSVFECK